MMGKLLNQRLYHQSCSFPAVADLDLVSLIKFSTESFYNATDARFRAFIEEASRVTFQYRDKTVEAIKHRKNSLWNIVKNVLKARNQHLLWSTNSGGGVNFSVTCFHQQEQEEIIIL